VLKNWIDAGALPAARVGRRVRVPRSDLERLIEASAGPAPAGPADGASAQGFWDGSWIADAVGTAHPTSR
jgi:hypothetical protein